MSSRASPVNTGKDNGHNNNNVTTPAIQFLLGLEERVSRNIVFVDENTVVFPCGHAIVLFHIQSRTQEFLHCSAHVRKITALSISNNKKFLAVAGGCL